MDRLFLPNSSHLVNIAVSGAAILVLGTMIAYFCAKRNESKRDKDVSFAESQKPKSCAFDGLKSFKADQTTTLFAVPTNESHHVHGQSRQSGTDEFRTVVCDLLGFDSCSDDEWDIENDPLLKFARERDRKAKELACKEGSKDNCVEVGDSA